jgi:hypothetical protein
VFVQAGTDVIEEWFASLPPKVRPKLRALLAHMEITERWVRPYFGKIEGYENLYGIRTKVGVQYRLPGCFGPNQREFTLHVGSTKAVRGQRQSTVGEPRNALALADPRRRQVFEDSRCADEYQ